MKFLGLVFKSAKRSKRRTALTMISVAVAVFLFSALRAVLDGFDSVAAASSATRVVTIRSTSMIFSMPMTHAEAIRAYHAGEHAKSAKLLFDAVQAFASLKLDYERAVALADLARALGGVPGREEQAQAQCDEAKASAGRLGATALRVAAENLTVRV